MVPAIKVYKMDYSFIIKNYLNPKLWQKTWTLFAFKDYVITLRLSNINTISNKITFKVTLTDNSGAFHFSSIFNNVDYCLNNSNVDFLIKNINGTIGRTIEFWERYYIFEETKAYKEAVEQEIREKEKLTVIAENFLDEHGIANDNIREAYIDAYVENSATAGENIDNLRSAYKYHLITDLYLVFFESINDTDGYQRVLNALEENEIDGVMESIKDFEIRLETEDYEMEMQNLLETI